MSVRLPFIPAVLLLLIAPQFTLGQTANPPKTEEEAVASTFHCPSGTHDSGPGSGIVVRWCDTDHNGRPLYHGPLWRWYRSGKLEGKEYYLNGDAAGVWPSYYEDGHLSSLGRWDAGQKRGLWKYWDQHGSLATEVNYSDEGNSRTDYYSSGQKKAEGVFRTTGKIGKWTYWGEDGRQKAHCDFGSGLFSVPDSSCRLIADELSPKGFSLPVPVGSESPDGTLLLSVDSQTFRFAGPKGWVADTKTGRTDDLPLVFYPIGKKWRSPGSNMYIRVFFKEGRSFDQTISDEKANFQESVGDFREILNKNGRFSNGSAYHLSSITYKPVIETDSPFSIVASNVIYEKVAYIDGSDKIILAIVLTADNDQQLKQSSDALQGLLDSFSK